MTDHISTLPGHSGKGIRTKLGCFTCRARKVKCDLVRPTCQTCVRLSLDCTYTKPEEPMSIPRLRRGRKRRKSDQDVLQDYEQTLGDRRSSTNTMPDLWRYHGHGSLSGPAGNGNDSPIPTPSTGHHTLPHSLPFPAPLPLPHGLNHPQHGQGQRMGSWSGGVGGHKAIGMGLGDVGLASSVYLDSLMRATGPTGAAGMGARRESMPVHLPSSYGNGGREYSHSHYRSPTPQEHGIFNNYQINGNGRAGEGQGQGQGNRGMTPGHEGFGGDAGMMNNGPSSRSGSGSAPGWDEWDIGKNFSGAGSHQDNHYQSQTQGHPQGNEHLPWTDQLNPNTLNSRSIYPDFQPDPNHDQYTQTWSTPRKMNPHSQLPQQPYPLHHANGTNPNPNANPYPSTSNRSSSPYPFSFSLPPVPTRSQSLSLPRPDAHFTPPLPISFMNNAHGTANSNGNGNGNGDGNGDRHTPTPDTWNQTTTTTTPTTTASNMTLSGSGSGSACASASGPGSTPQYEYTYNEGSDPKGFFI